MPIGTVLIESLLRLLLGMQASGSGRPGEVRCQGMNRSAAFNI